MPGINLNDRIFTVAETVPGLAVNDLTRFFFQQNEDIVHASYEGGAVRYGSLAGLVLPDGAVDTRFHHIDDEAVIRTGSGKLSPERMGDGRIRITMMLSLEGGTPVSVTIEEAEA